MNESKREGFMPDGSPAIITTWCEEVDVTSMSKEQRRELLGKMQGKAGFINFATGWENQWQPNEKMFYTFWFEKVEKKDQPL